MKKATERVQCVFSINRGANNFSFQNLTMDPKLLNASTPSCSMRTDLFFINSSLKITAMLIHFMMTSVELPKYSFGRYEE